MTQCGAAGIRALWMAVYIAAVFEQERQDRNAERRAWQQEYHKRPDVLEKKRAYAREYSQRPEVRARKQAAEKTPEVRERRRASERRHREKHGYWTGDRPLDRSEGAGFIHPGGHVPDWVYRATMEHLEEHHIRPGVPSGKTREEAKGYTDRLRALRRKHLELGCERCTGRVDRPVRVPCTCCKRWICEGCAAPEWPGHRRRCVDCAIEGLDARSAAAVS